MHCRTRKLAPPRKLRQMTKLLSARVGSTSRRSNQRAARICRKLNNLQWWLKWLHGSTARVICGVSGGHPWQMCPSLTHRNSHQIRRIAYMNSGLGRAKPVLQRASVWQQMSTSCLGRYIPQNNLRPAVAKKEIYWECGEREPNLSEGGGWSISTAELRE